MDSAIQTPLEAPSSAQLQCAHNFKRNIAALAITQPELAESLPDLNRQVEWIFARDGTLTAIEGKKWWGGCSVPAKTAQELLRTLQITSSMACFLAPAHAAQIAYTLDHLKTEQAIIALMPCLDTLVFTLHCHDFSDDIAAHRLWFAAGEQWPVQMGQLFRSNPGLAIPQQFIRTVLLSDDTSAPLIASAQQIFVDELNHRSAALAQLREIRSRQILSTRKRITLAAPMSFRLWDDCGGILQHLASGDSSFDWTIINFDDPIRASPLALASAAAESDAVLSTNLTRADCGHFLHTQIPLITWLTQRPVLPFDTAGPHDALILCDIRSIELAKKIGWPANRLSLLPWPAIAPSIKSDHLSIIADTRVIDSNPTFDLSSHQLLWDFIRAELADHPAHLNGDVSAYFRLRMKRLGVADHGLDHRRFIEDLIIPLYQQSIAARLISSNLPLKIFGRGWREIPNFSTHAAGPISSRDQLKHAISTSAALVHLWPTNHTHPIDAAGPPVIRLISRGISGTIADARLALGGRLKPARPAADSVGIAAIASTLRGILGQ